MKETSKITYDFGKLKMFLTLIRLIIQDTTLTLEWENYNKLKDFILGFIPVKVDIQSTNIVVN